jgi:hypothetical protein
MLRNVGGSVRVMWSSRALKLAVAAALLTTAVTVVTVSEESSSGASAVPASSFEDISSGDDYSITAPPDGDVTDGGLIISLARGQAATLAGIELLDHQGTAPLQLQTATVLPLSDTDLTVGIRQGQPSLVDPAGNFGSLDGQILTSGASVYELVLGIHSPAGEGPWKLTNIKLFYRVGSVLYYQVFPHDLTVCGASLPCGTVGTMSIPARTSPGGWRVYTCDAGTRSWVSGKPVQAWLATNVHSYWEGSGGEITLSYAHTTSFTMAATASLQVKAIGVFDFLIADVIGTAKASFGLSLTYQTETTSNWQYSVNIPSNALPERLTVYVRGWALPVTTEVYRSNCSASYTYGTVDATDANTSEQNGSYCIGLDVWPGRDDLGPNCRVS